MIQPNIFITSASLILTDCLPAGEGLIAYNLIKFLSNTNRINLTVSAPKIKINDNINNIELINKFKYKFFPAPEQYKYLVQWDKYCKKINKIYNKKFKNKKCIIHHMLPMNQNQSYSPVLKHPLIIGPIFYPWLNINESEYSNSEIKNKKDFVLIRKYKNYKIKKLKIKNRYLYNETLENADKIIITLDCVKQFIPKNLHNKTVKIPIGTDTYKFKPVNELPDNNTILFLAYLVRRKGLEYLIQAMDIIRKRVPDVKLIIAGDGPDKQFFLDLTNKLNLKNNIEFTGNITHKNTIKYFNKSQLYVLPSLGEPFGMSVVEAMSCGLPVIGTNAGGLPEVLGEHNKDNLVEPRDVQQLSDKILEFLLNYDKSKETGILNREFAVRNYDWRTIVNKYIQVYTELWD